MQRVDTKRTIVSLYELVQAFVWAFIVVHGEPPEPIDVAFIWGKLIAECGWPGSTQSVWCWNIGNVRGVSPDGLYCVLAGAWELAPEAQVPALLAVGYVVMDPPPPQAVVTPGTVCVLPPPEKQGFRAYTSLREACVDYARTLERRFVRTWKLLTALGTNPALVVQMMKTEHYFSGDLSTYGRNVQSGANWALPLVAQYMPAAIAAAQKELAPTREVLPTHPDTAATPIQIHETERTLSTDEVSL
jgi:hypothetical protein